MESFANTLEEEEKEEREAIFAAPAPEALPNVTMPTTEETAQERVHREWQELTRDFWTRHQEILQADGVKGFRMDTKKPGPITVTLDKNTDLPRARQQVRDLFAAVGLAPDDLRFEQGDLPPEHPHIIHQKPESDVKPSIAA